MATMMTSLVFWFQIPKPKNKTERKKSILPMAHYCMATPPDSGMARGTLSLEIMQKSSYIKFSRKVRRLGGETGQFRHNRETNA
jgi:hypothetical protein